MEIEPGDAVQIVSAGDTQTIAGPSRYRVLGSLSENSLNNFPERWTRIRVSSFNSTNPPLSYGSGSEIAFLLPYSELLANSAVAEKVKNWTYFRGDLDVLGVVDFPGNVSGAYAFCLRPRVLDPSVQYTPSLGGSFNPESVLGYEHSTLLLAADSSNIEFHVPFFSAGDANLITDPDGLGHWVLSMVCLSPLRTAIPGGVTTGNITWYARFRDGYELLVPRWQGAPVYQGKKEIVSMAKDLKKSKAISKTAATIKGVADKLVGVPFLGQAASMVSMAAGTAGAIADFFGFSRTNENVALQPFVTRSVKNVALTDGADCGDVAGFSMRNRISIAPDLLGGENADPMSFESMAQRWTCVSTFAWNALDEGSTVLKEVPVTPGYSFGSLSAHHPTPAGYCGLPFDYWRAEAEYLVVVPCSVLHRGSLQVLYIPPDSTSPVAIDNVTNVGMGAIMDVSAATQFQFHVGFSSNKPMLELAYFNDAWPIKPIGTANGVLQFRVVNPLRSQNPVDLVDISVFVRFKNVQFAVPRSVFKWPDEEGTALIANPWEQAVELQGRAVGDGQEEEPILEVDLVPGSGPYPVTEVVAGEDIKSLRALAQRPSRIKLPAAEQGFIIPGGMGGLVGNSIRLTTAGLAMQPFVLGAASERVKIFPRTDAWVGCASFNTTGGILFGSRVSAHMPMTFFGPQRGAEFVIPYYYPRRGRSYRSYGLLSDAQLDALQRVIAVRFVSNDLAKEVYYSLGDDIRVGPYMRTPRFLPRRTVDLASDWFPA